MTKEEKIKEAWGDYWDEFSEIKQHYMLNNFGWVLIKSVIHIEFSIEMEYNGRYARPLSLQGIEHNNGWIKINSEEDLPKYSIEYHVVKNGKLTSAHYMNNNRWIVPENPYPKTSEIIGITHYQPIEVKELPIF